MTFDVAITTFRRPDLVVAAVRSCLLQGALLDRVIVVDDASGDATVDAIGAIRDPRIILIVRPENGGIAAARRDAYSASRADWTVSLDSDHELLPGALEKFAKLAHRVNANIDILGGRYIWDDGKVSPLTVPSASIGYEDRIRLSGRSDSIGQDYVCAISRRLRGIVAFEPLRAGLPDTLFQLDLAKNGRAAFTSELLALQKSTTQESWTRGTADQRWARRVKDAPDGIVAVERILMRHGAALVDCSPALLARILCSGAFYGILCRRRRLAFRWACRALLTGSAKTHALSLLLLTLFPTRCIKGLYVLRG